MAVSSEFGTSDLHMRKDDRNFKSIAIDIDGVALETTPVFDAYWYFAAERQRIFLRRTKGVNTSELTSDPVLAVFKFTNAYRASDRVSQYLIRKVIYRDDLPTDLDNLLFRIFFQQPKRKTKL